MTPEIKRRTGFLAGVASLAAVLAILSLWAFSRPHTPLEYLVGGTLATSILLAAAFVQIVKKGYLGPPPRVDTVPYRTSQADPQTGNARVTERIARRSGQSS